MQISGTGKRFGLKPYPRSAWNLLLAPFCVIGIGGAWIGILLLFAQYRKLLCPADAFLCNGTRIGNILFYVAPIFPSIAAGMIVGNFLLWCIPPARAAMKREDGDHVFRTSQIGLAKVAAIMAAIALPLCFLGANHMFALAPERIVYRSTVSIVGWNYPWSSVTAIETACHSGKGTTYDFVLVMDDATKIDVMQESPLEFVEAYPQVQAGLRGKSYRFDARGLVGTCVAGMPRTWREILSKPPTN